MSTKKRLLLVLSTIAVLLCLCAVPALAADVKGLPEVPAPLDPQTWKFQNEMTWDEYRPNPAVDWSTFDISKTKDTSIHGLVILVDFPDRSFVVTQEPGSELVGNPGVGPIAKEDLAQFYLDHLNKPTELNHGATISEYWRENSFGKWDVTLDAVGPFTMPGFEMQYGFSYGTTTSASNPLGDTAPGITRYSSSQYTNQAVNLAITEGKVNLADYDFCFILHAGYDESGTWQEFGEMMFETKEDVPYEFGALARVNKILELGYELPQETIDWAKARDAAGKNWAKSRYGNDPWSSWYGSMGRWSFASSTTAGGKTIRISVQGESDGMGVFAHEFGHIRTLTDNYTDPFVTPSQRSYSAPWDTMGTGKIGPGGNHTRWQIPSTLGSSSPIHMMLRTKLTSAMGFITPSEILDVNINDLRNGTPVMAQVSSRNVPTGELFGINTAKGIRINGMVEQKPVITRAEDWMSDTFTSSIRWNGYCVEVVDRSGYDSFASDHGVLISKYRTAESAPHTWVIDAHPEEMDIVDYISPEGNEVKLSQGDMLQLADATFHAGLSEIDHPYGFSGDTVNEYVDPWNGLHFYILDKVMVPGEHGEILSYNVAVRATDATLGTNPDASTWPKAGLPVGGELTVAAGELIEAAPGLVAVQNFTITNTGDAMDIIRINVSDIDFPVTILNNLYAIQAGETITVPVYVEVPFETDVDNMMGQSLIFTASSETNATKVGTAAISTLDLVAGGKANLRLVTDANLVKSGDYFRANAYFREAVDGNTATVEFVFDTTKFSYRGFTPAEGVEVLNTAITDTGVKFTFMKRDYVMKSFGEALFSAKEDIDMAQEVNELKVIVDYVARENGEKVVKQEVASTCFTTLPPIPIPDYSLVVLSNLIDVFGMRNTHADWNTYRFYDFNKNNQIDILDISKLASMLK